LVFSIDMILNLRIIPNLPINALLNREII